MKRWRVHPARGPLRGALRVQGDPAIAVPALLLAALARGASSLGALPDVDDVRAALGALTALGVPHRRDEQGVVHVEGVGLHGLRAPVAPIPCGASRATLSILAGLLSAQHSASELRVDPAISALPLRTLARALRNRGARIEGTLDVARNDELAPLAIGALPAGARLNECELLLDAPDVDTKSALLAAGLDAQGPTALTEPLLSPDHTERVLDAMGAALQTLGSAVLLEPLGERAHLRPLALRVPGDPTLAMAYIAAAHVVPGSRLIVRDVCVNRTRTGALDALRDMGGGVIAQPRDAAGSEPVADLHVGAFEPAEVRSPARVGAELAQRAQGELALLVAVACVCPRGTSELRDLEALRSGRTDLPAALVTLVRAFGLEAELLPDGLRLQGGRPRGGVVVSAGGDARVARAAAVIALAAAGPTEIHGVDCVDASEPGFAGALRKLGVEIEVEG